MKQTTLFRLSATLLLILVFQICAGAQQLTWVKARNGNFYYQTNAGADFTWSGGSQQNYCHGYGTLQFYDNGVRSVKYVGNVSYGKNEGYGTVYLANGSIYYDGYWKNDKKHGYGSLYNQNGQLTYRGYFDNDKIQNESYWEGVAKELANIVIDDVFDGGSNGRYILQRCIVDRDGNATEMHVRVTFNGNIVATNYYACTLAVSTSVPYVRFIECNDKAKDYLDVKLSLLLIEEISKVFSKKR